MSKGDKNRYKSDPELVDAIRGVLGLAPIYAPDTVRSYITGAHVEAMGDGNHKTPVHGSLK